MEKFYTSKYDRPFKEIFLKEKNKDLLKSLLETILEIEINNIEIRPTERNNGNINIKRKTFDALVYTNNKKIEIEVNNNIKDYTRARNMAYISDIYASNTLKGEIYTEEIDIIQINLTYGMKDSEKYRIYKIQDKYLKEYVKNLYIYEINMDYYKEIWYTNSEEEIEKNKYILMLDLNKEELKKLEKISKDERVGKYMEEIERLNEDIEFRRFMSEEEDLKKQYNTEIYLATKKGIEKGIIKGKKEGIIEGKEVGKKETETNIVKELLKQNVSIEIIMNATGLSKEEIENLK